MPKKHKKVNAGWFKKGHDPRRRQLTQADRAKGFLGLQIAVKNGRVPSRVLAHVRRKIRATGSISGQHRQEEAEEIRRHEAPVYDNDIPF